MKLLRSQYLMDMSSEQDRSPELSERNLVLYTGPQCPLRIFISVPALSSSSSWSGKRKKKQTKKSMFICSAHTGTTVRKISWPFIGCRLCQVPPQFQLLSNRLHRQDCAPMEHSAGQLGAPLHWAPWPRAGTCIFSQW